MILQTHKYKRKKEKSRRRGIRNGRIHCEQTIGNSKVLSGRDHNCIGTARSRLGDDHAVNLHLLLNCMNGVNILITDDVISSRRRRDNVVYYDLGQVKVGISSSHLLQAILEPVAVVDTACIEEGLGNAKICHGVGSGLLHLFTKSG